ncbi:MAG TPA: 50S ribosomal protein L7/L12, partial [Opitutae bacterium]|nr:50S ribosomal protein L7/L12 [Opitutae bacterium]
MSDLTKDQVVEWLSGQSVMEIADLVKELEEKWDVSAAAPAAVAV